MKPEDVAKLLGRVGRIVDDQWKALGPEKRKRICENLMKRAEARIKAKERDVKGGRRENAD